jgi:hypothetical protein
MDAMRWFAWLSVAVLVPLVQAGCGTETTSSNEGAGGEGGVLTGANVSNSASSASGAGPSTSSTGGNGGAGGATQGGGCPPSGPFNGPKLSAPADQWTWVPVPGAQCRDGSATGFGVRLHPGSSKVFIYLEGGGACFNGTTCAINSASFGQLSFDAWKSTLGALGIFDKYMPENPLRDWNAIYVPYCTGDIHGGAGAGVDVPGFGNPKDQQFVGYTNLDLYLQRIVPTFPLATQVLLTGISAGGFGAAYTYDHVASAFCPLPVTLIDDSGPPMSDTYLAPCLQKQWKGLWNFAATLPPGCPACNGADGGGIANYASYIEDRWPNAKLGLISSLADSVISVFFGFGANDCTFAIPLSGATYAAGLADLRDNYLSASGRWGTYFVDSTVHTYLAGPGFYTTTVSGKKLTTWVAELLAGKPSNVAP